MEVMRIIKEDLKLKKMQISAAEDNRVYEADRQALFDEDDIIDYDDDDDGDAFD